MVAHSGRTQRSSNSAPQYRRASNGQKRSGRYNTLVPHNHPQQPSRFARTTLDLIYLPTGLSALQRTNPSLTVADLSRLLILNRLDMVYALQATTLEITVMTSPEQTTQDSDREYGALVKKAGENARNIRRLKNELRDLSKEYACLAKLLDPDTGSFDHSSTMTAFVKKTQESPPKSKVFSMPNNPGELICKIANLERETEQIMAEIQKIDPCFDLEIPY